jgi:hypothetical protein
VVSLRQCLCHCGYDAVIAVTVTCSAKRHWACDLRYELTIFFKKLSHIYTVRTVDVALFAGVHIRWGAVHKTLTWLGHVHVNWCSSRNNLHLYCTRYDNDSTCIYENLSFSFRHVSATLK